MMVKTITILQIYLSCSHCELLDEALSMNKAWNWDPVIKFNDFTSEGVSLKYLIFCVHIVQMNPGV